MAIETKCAGCGRKLQVGDEYAGQQARCPVCSTLNQLPTLEEAAAARAPVQSQPAASAAPGQQVEEPRDVSPDPEPEPAKPAPPPDNTPWWMTTPEGPTYGPVPKDTLDDWVRQGRVDGDCLLRRGEMGPWQSAAAVYPVLQPPLTNRPARRSPAAAGPTTVDPADGTTPLRRGGQAYMMPGRGPLILVLGILGWIACPIFGVMAWVMGTADLNEMRERRMDPASIGATQAGRVLGMICSIFWIVALVVIMFLFLYVVSA